MKKQLFLVMLALASLQMFALEIEEGKIYTIRNHSSTPAYMADNNADDNQIKCVATITDACFWEFVPTSNTNCYYVKNQKTGRYIQGYSSNEEMVVLGTNGVEYQVESFTDEDGKFGFSYTGNTPHNFSSGTIGLNLKGESNETDCYVQSYDAVHGTNHRSFWTLEVTAGIHDHSYNNGICTIEGCWDKYQPATQDGDGWYQLGNVGNVEWFSAQIADGNSTYKAKLTADIDYEGLGENYHTPIGNYGQKFIGKFDGCGYSIKNMVLVNPTRPKTDGSDGYGFFGCVRLGGDNGANLVEIKNLTIDSSCSVSANKNYVSGLIGRISENTADCTVRIENCINKASVTSSTNGNAGGLIGQINNPGGTGRTVEIINCENQGAITATTNNAGGLVGQVNVVTLNITNSTNTGSVSAKNYAAGILAQINAAAVVKISGCENRGVITTTELAAAGIVSQINGQAATLTIESCMNFGTIQCNGGVNNSKNAGGIFGANTSSKGTIHIINCGNTGNVTGKSESAALTGWIGSNSGQVISNCWNSGIVTGHSGASMYLYRDQNSSTTATNLYDASGVGTQGTAVTNADISSGKLCYLLNGSQSNNVVWYQSLIEGSADPYPMPFVKDGAIVYANGNLNCDGTPKEGVSLTYSNLNEENRDPHTPGGDYGFICSVCNAVIEDYVSKDADDYYHLSTVGQVEWLSAMVEAGHGDMKVKLDGNINYAGKTHAPIGQNTLNKFKGIFDGQGNQIQNLTMTGTNTGFFGFVAGGATIQNIIIDDHCSFSADERCGSLIAIVHEKAGGPVSINNVVNYASVTSGTKVAGGIIAAGWTDDNHPVVNMANCVNAGAVKSTGGDKAVGLLGWNKSASISTLKACYNIGVLDPIDGANNLFRGNNRSMPNSYDLVNTTAQGKTGTQGLKTDWGTEDPLHSGELCYVLNHGAMSANGIPYKQDLSVESIPLPVTEGLDVNFVGNVGYSTMYDASNDWELNGDAQAYIGTISGSALHLEEIDDIPAGTAVVISGTYYNKVSATATATTTGNVLKGSDGTKTGGDGIYALAIKNEKVGFYPVASTVTIPAGKAYLEVTSGEAPVKGFYGFDDDDATGIENLNVNDNLNEGTIYNVAGQRINKMQKGINIVNGKKILK